LTISVESSSSESGRDHEARPSVESSDLKDTFGTNSPVLMQYKYTDARDSYGRLVKKLAKKSKQMKQVLEMAEFEKCVNNQLKETNAKLHETIDQVCFRYLDLLDIRVEEVMNLFYINCHGFLIILCNFLPLS
jgi:hypothetical protein